ncbi:MAG: hypothetical protein VYD19_06190, partial [Myxococcota bacterium]|nr:hypothetical protein [Myxococcota bacterium]
MTELWLCVACTLAVPFLEPLTTRWSGVREVFRGFTFFALLCLLFGELLPDAVSHGGLWVLLSALIGALLPRFLEESGRWNTPSLHRVMVWLGVSVFVGHAALDGFVLGFADQDHHGHTHHGFAFGVVFHRFPVAFSIWWLLGERLGMRSAYFALIALALATIGGALSDEHWLDELSALNFGLIQGLVCGLFVHVLFHQPHDHHIRGPLLDRADEKKLLGDPLG